MKFSEFISPLLFEEEGSSLDFKAAQYKFQGATDEDKSELLKDILALANAWRRSTAYIVIGVVEKKGERNLIEGILQDIDDSRLQQFIQSKVNKPLEFSYKTGTIEGKKVAVIAIPTQTRPFFLKKDYGRLSSGTVYIRRGSATEVALPDEVARMGAEEGQEVARAPKLVPFIARGEHNEVRAEAFVGESTIAEIPSKEDFNPPRREGQAGDEYWRLARLEMTGENPDYNFEYAQFFQEVVQHVGFKIGVENSGNAVARDVRVTIEFKELPSGVAVVPEWRMPKAPKRSRFPNPMDAYMPSGVSRLHVESTADGYRVEVELGKIQAKDEVIYSELLFIRAEEDFNSSARIRVFCDDLEEPTLAEFPVEIRTRAHVYSVGDFVKDE